MVHVHNHCHHVLRFCQSCNAVYCESCKQEWTERQPTLSVTYWPYIDWSDGVNQPAATITHTSCSHSQEAP